MGSFPYIIQAVRTAPEVALESPGSAPYVFRLFSFGERGTELSPELLNEIVEGLVASVAQFGSFDYIVAPEPGGHTWGMLLALKTGKPLHILRSNSSYVPSELEVRRKTGYYQHNLYFPQVQADDRILVIDDVVSTGGTLSTIIETLQQLRAVPVGVQLIYAKSSAYEALEARYGVRISPLVRFDDLA